MLRETYLVGGSFTPSAQARSQVLTNAPVGTSACFLTGFSGRLKNTDTALQQVFISEHSNGTYWVVGSSAESDEKTIWWACVRGVPSNQYVTDHWSTSARDPSAVDLGPSSDRLCFINTIEGWFNGSGEQVRTRISGGRWLLDGTMGTLHPYYIGAGATCILGATATERSGEYGLASPAGSGSSVIDLPYDANDGYGDDADVCGLTRLGGQWGDGTIASRQARAYTDGYGPSPAGPWHLWTTSTSSQVSIGVRCAIGSAFVVSF